MSCHQRANVATDMQLEYRLGQPDICRNCALHNVLWWISSEVLYR